VNEGGGHAENRQVLGDSARVALAFTLGVGGPYWFDPWRYTVSQFAQQVRDALGLSPQATDEAVIAEIQRLRYPPAPDEPFPVFGPL
jgi:hypothetical protein